MDRRGRRISFFSAYNPVNYVLLNFRNFQLHTRLQCANVLLRLLFRLDALAKALSVIATVTWLAGWLGGWVAGWVSVTAGIVSKRLNLSENFLILDHLVGPSFKHLGPITPIPNSTGHPFIGGVKYTGVGNWRLSTYIAVYLGNGAR